MVKLTEAGIAILEGLEKGHSLEICTQVGQQFGDIHGKENFKGRIFQRTLGSLYQSGLIVQENTIHFGIRFIKCQATPRAIEFIRGLK
ncbi:MAG: hypothetical protein HWE07_00365 [Cytophagia bacterium]|nr:hypothetical protein [Cytophagia bacterium]